MLALLLAASLSIGADRYYSTIENRAGAYQLSGPNPQSACLPQVETGKIRALIAATQRTASFEMGVGLARMVGVMGHDPKYRLDSWEDARAEFEEGMEAGDEVAATQLALSAARSCQP